jgi:mono/diheme cytochrome c family protein
MIAHALIALATLIVAACSAKPEPPPAATPPAAGPAAGPLSAFELEHGIGPVKEVVTLGPLDAKLAERGRTNFEGKCSACHKMGEKYVGPALGEVTTVRSPAYIMNMVLNPMEMVERHPVAKQLLAEHMSFMANQGVTIEEARAIVEYLRTQATGTVRTQ